MVSIRHSAVSLEISNFIGMSLISRCRTSPTSYAVYTDISLSTKSLLVYPPDIEPGCLLQEMKVDPFAEDVSKYIIPLPEDEGVNFLSDAVVPPIILDYLETLPELAGVNLEQCQAVRFATRPVFEFDPLKVRRALSEAEVALKLDALHSLNASTTSTFSETSQVSSPTFNATSFANSTYSTGNAAATTSSESDSDESAIALEVTDSLKSSLEITSETTDTAAASTSSESDSDEPVIALEVTNSLNHSVAISSETLTENSSSSSLATSSEVNDTEPQNRSTDTGSSLGASDTTAFSINTDSKVSDAIISDLTTNSSVSSTSPSVAVYQQFEAVRGSEYIIYYLPNSTYSIIPATVTANLTTASDTTNTIRSTTAVNGTLSFSTEIAASATATRTVTFPLPAFANAEVGADSSGDRNEDPGLEARPPPPLDVIDKVTQIFLTKTTRDPILVPFDERLVPAISAEVAGVDDNSRTMGVNRPNAETTSNSPKAVVRPSPGSQPHDGAPPRPTPRPVTRPSTGQVSKPGVPSGGGKPGNNPPRNNPPKNNPPMNNPPRNNPPKNNPPESSPPRNNPSNNGSPGNNRPGNNPPERNPPANDRPGSNPPGNNPPGNNPPGNNPPGNNPPGNNTPGNNPQGNNPPGSNTPGNNPPGRNPRANNPPGNNPPGRNPPANNPPGSNSPGSNPPGNNPPGRSPSANNPPGNSPPTKNPPGRNPQPNGPNVNRPGAGGVNPPQAQPNVDNLNVIVVNVARPNPTAAGSGGVGGPGGGAPNNLPDVQVPNSPAGQTLTIANQPFVITPAPSVGGGGGGGGADGGRGGDGGGGGTGGGGRGNGGNVRGNGGISGGEGSGSNGGSGGEGVAGSNGGIVLMESQLVEPGQQASINGMPVSFDAENSALIVEGTNTFALNPSAAPVAPGLVIDVGDQDFTVSLASDVSGQPGGIIIDGTQSLAPGQVTELGNVPVSVPQMGSAIVVGSNTIPITNTASSGSQTIAVGSTSLVITPQGSGGALVIGGSQTIAPGEVVIVNGVPVSLPASGSSVVISGSQTIELVGQGEASVTAPPVLFIGGDSFTATVVGGTSQFILGPDLTLTPGGEATVDGTIISLPFSPTLSEVIIDGITSAFVSPAFITPAPPLIVDGEIFSAVMVGTDTGFEIRDGQTLLPGGMAIIDGTTVSLPANGLSNSLVIINGATSTLTDTPFVTPPPITINDRIFTATVLDESSTIYSIAPGTTLTPGGVIIIDGTTISLPASASDNSILIINGATSTIPDVLNITPPPAITIDDEVYSATVIGSSTFYSVAPGIILTPGGVVTVDRTRVSLLPDATAVVYDDGSGTDAVTSVLDVDESFETDAAGNIMFDGGAMAASSGFGATQWATCFISIILGGMIVL